MRSDPDRRFCQSPDWPPTKPTAPPLLRSRDSEESIRTEFCDGPLSDDALPDQFSLADISFLKKATLSEGQRPVVSSRQDLIKRIKRGESPAWAPARKVRQAGHSAYSSNFTFTLTRKQISSPLRLQINFLL